MQQWPRSKSMQNKQRILTLSTLLLAALLGVQMFATGALAQAPLVIVPAGDSITEGCCNPGNVDSYRAEFIGLMNASSCGHEMRGSQLETANSSSFQSFHEGYSGWRALHFIDGATAFGGPRAIAATVDAERPDVILLHIGSNDLNGTGPADHVTVDQTLENIRLVLDRLNTQADDLGIPRPKVLLAKPIPWFNPGPSTNNESGDNSNIQSDIEALGIEISTAISSGFPISPGSSTRQPPLSNVYEVDPFTGFTIDMMQSDLIHPNNLGEKHVAQAFFSGMVDAGLCSIPVEQCNGLPVDVNLLFGQTPTSQADVILGTTGADTIVAMGGDDTICALGGNDIINGGNGNDWINAGAGDDIVDGGNNDDTIFGNDGNDTLNGGPGNDVISGENGNDFIRGNSGNDTLHGANGIDQIIAGSGNDIVTTGSGGNLGTGLIVDGGAGNDHITGGSGNDEIRGATGNDTILGDDGNDELFGGGGNDSVNGQNGDDLIRGNGSRDTIFGGNGEDDIDGGADIDTIFGGNDDDTISGSTGNDIIQGNAGNDTIRGGGGNDTLYGNRGDDMLFGGGSNDTLIGGSDNDTCTGDSGNDTASSCEEINTVP